MKSATETIKYQTTEEERIFLDPAQILLLALVRDQERKFYIAMTTRAVGLGPFNVLPEGSVMLAWERCYGPDTLMGCCRNYSTIFARDGSNGIEILGEL